MGVIVPVGEAGVILGFSVNGSAKQMSVTFGLRQFATSPGDWETAAEAVVESFCTDTTGPLYSFLAPPNFSEQWSFDTCEVSEMTATGPLPRSAPGIGSGSQATTTIPANCCTLMTKQTSLGGRKYRGRCYWPAMFQDEQYFTPAGTMDPLRATELRDEWDQTMAALLIHGFQPVLHHSDGSPGNVINGVSFSTLIGTQRRRLR